jgi:hypothetical protein
VQPGSVQQTPAKTLLLDSRGSLGTLTGWESYEYNYEILGDYENSEKSYVSKRRESNSRTREMRPALLTKDMKSLARLFGSQSSVLPASAVDGDGLEKELVVEDLARAEEALFTSSCRSDTHHARRDQHDRQREQSIWDR